MEKLGSLLPTLAPRRELSSPPSTTTEAEEREIAEAERKRREDDRCELILEQTDIPMRYYHYSLAEHFHAPAYERVRHWENLSPEFWAAHPDGVRGDDPAIVEWEAYRRNGLYLYGPYGSGKTAIGCAVLKERAVREFQGGLFITSSELLDRLRRSIDGEPDDVLMKAKEVGVLMLDDIGAEKMTDWVRDRLFALINERYNREDMAETIFTSNLAPQELAGHVGERIAWRIMEMCRPIKLTGNFRKATTSG